MSLIDILIDNKVKIISGLIGSLITSIGTVFISTHQQNQINDLSKENGSMENRIDILVDKNSTLNGENKLLSNEHNSLTLRFNALEEKYNRCISSDGLETIIESTDTHLYTRTHKTGGSLVFRLTTGAIRIKIVRVTDRGPVISISGCMHYILDNESRFNSLGGNQYLLQAQTPLRITYTPDSCELDEEIDFEKAEEVVLTTLEYNADEQTALIEYGKHI